MSGSTVVHLHFPPTRVVQEVANVLPSSTGGLDGVQKAVTLSLLTSRGRAPATVR